jgi:hypothetical protein
VALGSAVGTGEDLLVGLEAAAPAVHALARSATAITTAKIDARSLPLMS